MQYKTGSISVYFPSGDTFTYTVLGNGTSWLANASAGDVLYIGTSAAPYVIGRVISDTELRVISPVSQEYEQEDYSIVRDFTLNFNLPLLSMQDRNAPDIISRAFQILDEKCSIPLTGYDELMFDNDENIGLYFHVRSGALRINNDIVLFNAATIELNDDSTLLVGIDETGELDFIDYVSGEEYPDRFLPLYIVQTLGGAVYHVDDIRAPYFVPYGLCYYQDDMEITGTWHFSSVKVEDVKAGSVSASNIVSSYGTIPYLKTTLLYADSGETININNEIDVDGDVYCHRIYADGETQFAEITPPSGESLVLNGDVIVNGSLTLYGDGSGNDVIMQSDNGKLSLNSDLTIGVNTFYCGTVYTDSVNSPIGTFDGISLGSLILYNNTISSKSGEDIYIDTGSGVLYINGEEYSGGSGGGGGSIDIENVITVAKSGGDYDDIHDAVAASSAGDVILVFPGTYTVSSSININKNITVSGVDRRACIIEREHATSAEVAYDDGVFLFSAGLPDGARLANLTIKNTGNSTGTYATPAVIATDGNNHIQNCYIGGNGGSDILCFMGSSAVSCDTVTVEQYKKYLSNASPIIRVRGSSNLTFEHGEVVTLSAGGGTQLNTTGDAAFRWTDFRNTEGIDVVKCETLTLFGCRKDAAPFLISNNYTALKVNSCDYMDAFVNYGNLALNSDSDIGGKKLFKMHWYDNPDNYYFKIDPIDGLYWGEGDNENYDTRLYRMPYGGVGTNSVYSSHALLWKDWAAVAACGAAVVWDGNRGRNVGWSPGYGDETGCYFYNYLLSDDDGQRVYFPIPYEAGTILTRLRVKWCANAQDNGVKVRLVKRDETAYNDAWTVVGAQQSYIDSAGDLNININTYDFADETMQAKYSYSIEVESVVDNPVGVRLYSVGIETSKRVY